jgi:DNA-binding transcriptional ArsR family regulator
VATTAGRLLPHPDLAAVTLPEVLFALSDPTRLDLVRKLAARGPLTVAECHAADPAVPKSTYSHHLKTLREAGLVRNEPAGRQRTITLRAGEVEHRFPGLLGAVTNGEHSAESP